MTLVDSLQWEKSFRASWLDIEAAGVYILLSSLGTDRREAKFTVASALRPFDSQARLTNGWRLEHSVNRFVYY